jgi:hypothetical protein
VGTNWVVTTLAGLTGVNPAGFNNSGGADGTGTNARFNDPQGVAVDRAGNVYVADTYNGAIREVTPAGVVTTLAGNGAGYEEGTGEPAQFSNPASVAVDGLVQSMLRTAATIRSAN